jgi:hypothetical protein
MIVAEGLKPSTQACLRGIELCSCSQAISQVLERHTSKTENRGKANVRWDVSGEKHLILPLANLP